MFSILVILLVAIVYSSGVSIRYRKNVGYGRNIFGLLGLGDSSQRNEEIVEVGYGTLFSEVSQPFRNVWAGYKRTFLLSKDNKIFGIGSNNYCGLGTSDEITNVFTKPTLIDQISDPSDPVVSMWCPYYSSIALTEKGIVWGFGNNLNSQLGDLEYNSSTTCSSSSPCNGPSDEKALSCDPVVIFPKPGKHDPTLRGVSIASGECHTLIVVESGVVFASGCNSLTQIMYSNPLQIDEFTPINFPKKILDPSDSIKNVSAGLQFSVYLTEQGHVLFSGYIQCLQNGNKQWQRNKRIVDGSTSRGKVRNVVAGETHIFGEFESGDFFVFGCNDYGVLGIEEEYLFDKIEILPKTDVFGPNGTFETVKKIQATGGTSAVLTDSKKVYYIGRTGESDIKKHLYTKFTRILYKNEVIEDISVAEDHFVSIGRPETSPLKDREMYCMGDNTVFQCGVSPPTNFQTYESFHSQPFTENEIVSIFTSESHAIAISGEGKVFSWGSNADGELGIGSFSDNFFLPYKVSWSVLDPTIDEYYVPFFVQAAASSKASYFLSDWGDLFVVGSGRGGELGLGSMLTDKPSPVRLPDSSFKTEHYINGLRGIFSSQYYVQAITDKGYLYAWGKGPHGTLGLGKSTTHTAVPMVNQFFLKDNQFNKFIPIRHLSTGTMGVVAITESTPTDPAQVYSWGQISMMMPTFDIIFTPTLQNFNPLTTEDTEYDVFFVTAGDTFILAGLLWSPSETFVLYYWGTKDGQSYPTPEVLWHSDTIQLRTCQASAHVVCLSLEGEAWGLGDNQYKQLSPYLSDISYPELIRIPINYTDDIYWTMRVHSFSRATVTSFSTILQEFVICHGKLDSQYDVCSGNGMCIKNDTCRCNQGWTGKICDQVECKGADKNITEDCRGRGKCVGPNWCVCDQLDKRFGWTNQETGQGQEGGWTRSLAYSYCLYPKCDCKLGECVAENNKPVCKCPAGYRGKRCQLPVCNGFHAGTDDDDDDEETSVNGCGSKSECTGPDNCHCVLNGLDILLPLMQSSDAKKGCTANPVTILVYIALLLLVTCVCSILCVCCFNFCCLFCCSCCTCSCWTYTLTLCGFCCCICQERAKSSALGKRVRKFESKADIEKHVMEFHEYCSPHQAAEAVGMSVFGSLKSKKGSRRSRANVRTPLLDQREEDALAREFGVPLDSSSLLRSRDRIFRVSETHVFLGDHENGEGTIFYARDTIGKTKKLFPVFTGHFVNGKREGYGIEFRAHFQAYPVGPDFYRNTENYRFAGIFKKDMREGKGTEYDESGKKTLVGEYVKDMLIRILSIDYPLKVFHLRRDIEYSKEKIGSGGFSSISAGIFVRGSRLDDSQVTEELVGKECAVKFFKDIYDVSVPSYHQGGGGGGGGEEEDEGEGAEYVSWKVGKNIYKEQIVNLEHRRIQRSVADVLKILGMFHHPNIIEIYGWSGPVRDIKDFGYVMEMCACSVRQRCSERENGRGISMREKILYLYQTCLAMKHVHHVMGLIHRDLKWANVLLDHVGQVKICDFDMADRDEMDFSGRKNTGAPQGSFFQMAPEVLECESYDHKLDVFSFGIMMFELLFNKMDDPYELRRLGKCHVCGEKYELPRSRTKSKNSTKGAQANYILTFLRRHFDCCELRPRMQNFELIRSNRSISKIVDGLGGDRRDEYDQPRVYKWQVQLMRRCWARKPEVRPSFKEIVDVFNSFHAKIDRRGGDRRERSGISSNRERKGSKKNENSVLYGRDESYSSTETNSYNSGSYHSIN